MVEAGGLAVRRSLGGMTQTAGDLPQSIVSNGACILQNCLEVPGTSNLLLTNSTYKPAIPRANSSSGPSIGSQLELSHKCSGPGSSKGEGPIDEKGRLDFRSCINTAIVSVNAVVWIICRNVSTSNILEDLAYYGCIRNAGLECC